MLAKFANPAALSVLNRGLIIGGMNQAFSARPDIAEAVLDGMEPLIANPEAKKRLTNLPAVAEEYFDLKIRARAKALLAQLKN